MKKSWAANEAKKSLAKHSFAQKFLCRFFKNDDLGDFLKVAVQYCSVVCKTMAQPSAGDRFRYEAQLRAQRQGHGDGNRYRALAFAAEIASLFELRPGERLRWHSHRFRDSPFDSFQF